MDPKSFTIHPGMRDLIDTITEGIALADHTKLGRFFG